MRIIFLSILAIFLSSPAGSEEALRVVDGDTVHQGFSKFRMKGYDSPELGHAKCPEEYALAVKATNRLIELIRQCGVEIVPLGTSCKWGRECAILKVGGKDVADRAVEEGWGQYWNGRWPKPEWCPAPVAYKPKPGC